jgi:hypothetical protein
LFFLNLSAAEFLALLAAAWGVVTALYLLDRSRRSVVVATLRLWLVSETLSRLARRRRIRQPWSLALQLAGILLVLAAAAGWRWSAPARAGRDHVILLDASAWMAARGRAGTLLDEAKAAAIAWVRAMPAGDRAMIVRTAGMAAPATRFVADRNTLEDAIRRTRAGATSLKLADAVRFAREAQRMEGGAAGEIVYAGPGRVSRQDPAPEGERLRVLPVSEPGDNCGLLRISLRRPDDDPEAWDVFATVRNYGRTRREVPVTLQFAGFPMGVRRLTLEAGEEGGAAFRFHARAAGWIDVRLMLEDALAADNHARVETPAMAAVRVLAYTARPNLLRPLLAASPNLEAVFAPPESYSADAKARIVILDAFGPAAPPKVDAIWIEPPAGASTFRVAATVKDAVVDRWHGENALGEGLWTKDIRLDSAQTFAAQPGDLPIAECSGGPVILARPGSPKAVAFGFHPGAAAMRSQLAAPLVFANILRWMAPEIFQRWEANGGSAGAVTAALDPGTDPRAVRVLAESGRELPFTVKDNSIRFFVGAPQVVRVLAGNQETVYSLTLPGVADGVWKPPKDALRGGGPVGAPASSRDPWPALAVAGMLAWIAEWLLFGRQRYAAARLPSPGGSEAAP